MKLFLADTNNLPEDQLSEMFRIYFEELNRMKTPQPLVKNGEKIWLETVKKSIGKTAVLAMVSDENNKLTGFGYGQLKLGPDYLGNKRMGTVSHFFISENYRGNNLAAQLFQLMKDWFELKSVESIELQVIHQNENAYFFWQKMGFQSELKQMRLMI